MVMTFSNKQRELAAVVIITIHGKPIEIVEEYKYLGIIFDNLLKFATNTDEILRKCQQQQYLLRKLNSFGISKDILKTFYYSFIESIMPFSFTCWFHSISLPNRNRLQSTVKVCSKIIGLPVRALSTPCEQQMLRSAGRILQDPARILYPVFEWLPSGHQLRCPGCRTQRRRATFVPKAVQLLNSQPSLSLCSPCSSEMMNYIQVQFEGQCAKTLHGTL
ncbi:uncharacterized protein LOC121900544 [Thunnus maccoyii]|uniref:uncharacterized protein LOC121900544 n=1 Tax=Thunnus maccoyii TaxID=8240 RepID=UPI001C4D6F53|nr:uncharacterized protein LOC121900544 [Thunnus maccoyii]